MRRKVEKNWGNIYITIYLFLVFGILPLYLENHHYNVGEAKSHFLYGISIIVILLLIIWKVICLWKSNGLQQGFDIKCMWNTISLTEKFLILYIIFVTASFAFSEYKDQSLWGIYDWRMGYLPIVIIAVMTMLIIHLWNGNRWIIPFIGSVSAIVFLLGVFNRFSVYPIVIEPMQVEFISTIGNINWFCGYLSVIASIGIGMFVFGPYTKESERWKKVYWGMYAFLSFVTGFCQGSDSVYLWFGTLLTITLWIALDRKEWIHNFLLLFIMWAMSAQFVRFVKFLAPGCFNYEAHKYLINSGFTLWLAIIGIIVYCLLFKNKGIHWSVTSTLVRNIRGLIIISVLLAVLTWYVLSLYNTNIGIPGLEENTMFLLNDRWGNDRGVGISLSLKVWCGMPLKQKLFGCGPEAFYYHMYSITDVAKYLRILFEDENLINAHCELATSLINIGLLGTIVYVACFISFVFRCMKKGKEQPLLYIPIICVACYFVHNLVSFAQVINYPYVFFILGMGEYYLKKSS